MTDNLSLTEIKRPASIVLWKSGNMTSSIEFRSMRKREYESQMEVQT